MCALRHQASDEEAAVRKRLYTMSPTGEAFHTSDAFVRAVMGPIGGGKTSMCCMELLFASLRQAPDPDTKIRSVRWAVTRATYSEIEHALMPTFEEWIGYLNPNGWKHSKPIEWSATIPLDDGTTLEIEVLFISVGQRENAAAKFRGLELTGLFVSEYSTLSVANFDIMAGRVGRWPKRRKDEDGNVLVECTEPCIILESNPPSRDSKWFHLFERNTTSKDRQIFHQPPAVIKMADGTYEPNPEADNYDNHSGGGDRYYRHQLATMDSEEQVKVYLMGQYGRSVVGNVVWPAFDRDKHVMQKREVDLRCDDKGRLKPLPNRAVFAGMDFGLNSAIVVGQIDDIGRLVILDALWEASNTSTFIDSKVLPLFQERYPMHAPLVFGDPTGVNRDGGTGLSAYSILYDASIKAAPAPTNFIAPRVGSVTEFLRMHNGIIIAPHCKELIEAIEADYIFVERPNNEPSPTKGDASHICDALSYLTVSLRAQQKSDTSLEGLQQAAARRREAGSARGGISSILGTV